MRSRVAVIGLLAVGTVGLAVGPFLLLQDRRSAPGDYLFTSAFFVAGACAIAMAPRHRASLRLLALGTLILAGWASGSLISIAYPRLGASGWLWFANLVQQLLDDSSLATLVALFALLPDGRYHHTYERAVVALAFLLALATPVLAVLTMPAVPTESWVWALRTVASPLYVPWLSWLAPGIASVMDKRLVSLLVAVLLLAFRYRGLDSGQRLQVRWVLIAGALLPAALVAATALAWLAKLSIPQPFATWAFQVAIGAVPVGILLSILRYRLLDADRLLRRMLVYALLWAGIGLVYVGLAALVGVGSARRLPLLAAVLLTILTTLAFQPARSRLERIISRLLFGQSADGYETIRALGAALEHAGGMEDVGTTLAVTVRRGLGATWTRVSLSAQSGSGPAEIIGSDGARPRGGSKADLAAPVALGGQVIGTIECGRRVSGDYGQRERELVATIGRQAAWAIRSSSLNSELAQRLGQLESQTAELAASRARLVEAGDQERRRIERNIHDGAQQQLVALMAKLRRARDQAKSRSASTLGILDELQGDAARLLDDLRELAQGIHPAVLADAGLLEAINARAERLPIPVTVATDPDFRQARFPEAIEGAAYFIVCEGLVNAAKHSGARRVRVALEWRDRALRIDVADDGRGFDQGTSAGSGLRGLSDRVAALGGTFEVESLPGHGTRLVAALPAPEPVLAC